MSRPKKSVSVDLGDLGIQQMRLDFNALATIEGMTGKNLLQGDTWANLSASDMRVIVWALLTWQKTNVPTLEQVGAEIDMDNLEYISDCIGKVVETGQPPEQEKDPNPPQEEVASIS
jgi:hypothetical protein